MAAVGPLTETRSSLACDRILWHNRYLYGGLCGGENQGFHKSRALFQMLAMLPMAIPGMVLGLAYIFFFNNPANPLNFIYGTMAILVVSAVTHFIRCRT